MDELQQFVWFSKLRFPLSLAVDGAMQLLARLLASAFLFPLYVFDPLYLSSLLWVFERNKPYLRELGVCFDADAQQRGL